MEVATSVGPAIKPKEGATSEPVIKPMAFATNIKPMAVTTSIKPITVTTSIKPMAVATNIKPITVTTSIKTTTVATSIKPMAVATSGPVIKTTKAATSGPRIKSKDVATRGPSADSDMRRTSDNSFTEESRFRVACNYITWGCKSFITFLFSHVGLTCFVAAYTLLGGVIFQKLELPHEEGIRHVATIVKNASVEKLVDFMFSDDASVVLRKSVWNTHVRRILREHEVELHRLVKEKNWDGSFGNEGYQWTFANSLLYSVTVITTIGYGNIAPKTGWGQFVTIVYATFGIPITMLCLRNIGDLLAGCFRLIYKFACVNMTYQYIKLQRRRLKNRFASRLRSKTHGLKEWAKRKQSEVSTLIHIAIDEHMHSTSDSDRNSRSNDDIHSGVLDPIAESIESDEDGVSAGVECKAGHKLTASADDIQMSRGYTKHDGKQRRNTISDIGRTHRHKLKRKHSLTSSKHHKSRDSMRHAKSCERQLSGSDLIVITEDEAAMDELANIKSDQVDVYDLSQIKADPDKSSIASSLLSLRDFEADERAMKARLKQTRTLVPISMCLLIMTGYIILGSMIFTPWEENWDFLIGFYFCFITLTTIGFGDFVPGMASSWDNDEKRVICLVYLLVGMALLAMSFHLIQEEVKHKCKKIAIKLGLLENKITQFLDSYDQPAAVEEA